jgi:ferrochelatase
MAKVGVLLVNLGTPDDPGTSSVRRYLKQFLLDGRVIDVPWFFRQVLVRGIIAPFRSFSSAKLYKELWTERGSPLKYYGYEVEKLLQDKLGDSTIVKLGMRYQNPSIESALLELRKANVDKIVVFPMFPQYASASTGSALQETMDIVSKWLTIPEIAFISSYHDQPTMIKVYAENAKKHDLAKYDHFLFSFHGIPQRQLIKSDCNNHCLKTEGCCDKLVDANKMCYSAQCYDTAYRIADEMGLSRDQYSISFQSRLGRDPWTEPFTPDMLKKLYADGHKSLLVFSPSFTSDCLETTIEIGFEYKEDFEEMGGEHLDLVESLNGNPMWVDAIEEMVKPHL